MSPAPDRPVDPRQPAGSLALGPALIGAVVGLASFAVMLAAGLLLYQRLFGDSALALVVILAVFGGLGAYLAWLVGVLTFSRLRRADEEPDFGEEPAPPAG